MTRYTFEFLPPSDERLQVIMDRCGVNDVACIIRAALRLFEWAVEEVEAGRTIMSVGDDRKGEWIDVHEGLKAPLDE